MLGKHFIVGFPPIPVFIILVVTHFSSLLRRQSNPLRRQSNPLRRQSNPLRRQSNPLRRQSNPLRRQSNPLRRQSNPLRRQSNPLRRQSNPLRRQSNPLRRQSNPLRRQSNPLRRQSNPLVYAVLYYCTISCFKSRWVARIYVVASDWLWTSEGGGEGGQIFLSKCESAKESIFHKPVSMVKTALKVWGMSWKISPKQHIFLGIVISRLH